ncbi:type II toxin-antitoxin system HicB family antitoxin [Methylobacter svalbardensis]|uniref:type II toxin-antitoxin system HicB family antitoxin n=1 Tax=Methylobacter svalbardensis TaxID=3080016 RepID=UPI0030EC3789
MLSTIKATICAGEESGFVAECLELPIVIQGQTLDEVTLNLREAISLHLEGEDLVALGFTPNVPIVISYEISVPLSSGIRQPVVSWLKRKMRKNILVLAGVSVVTLWLAALLMGQLFFTSWEERGQFGDLFGSVNALFSGLAFVALIYTIHLQRQELSLQRIELKLQREEMVASRGELAAQVAAQKSLVESINNLSLMLKQAFMQMNFNRPR